jgi:hypothetical protein
VKKPIEVLAIVFAIMVVIACVWIACFAGFVGASALHIDSKDVSVRTRYDLAIDVAYKGVQPLCEKALPALLFLFFGYHAGTAFLNKLQKDSEDVNVQTNLLMMSGIVFAVSCICAAVAMFN